MFDFSTIPMDLIPERKTKRNSKYAESIDEIPCHEDTCAYEDEPESGNVSKAASMMIPPPSVLIQGCTPPSEEELYLNTDLFPESHSSECKHFLILASKFLSLYSNFTNFLSQFQSLCKCSGNSFQIVH